jgi:putative sterol carrier protein
MSFEGAKEKITAKVKTAPHVDGKFKFDFGEDGVIFVDNTQNPPAVSEADEKADVTLVTSLSTFEDLLSGKQDPNIAFMMGKLKVKGNIGLAMKLNAILEE